MQSTRAESLETEKGKVSTVMMSQSYHLVNLTVSTHAQVSSLFQLLDSISVFLFDSTLRRFIFMVLSLVDTRRSPIA